MLIGTLSSFASGACFPLLLVVYQQVTDALVNYGKLKYVQQNNLTNLTYLSCQEGGYVAETTIKLAHFVFLFSFGLVANATTPIQAIENIVPYYVLLGFLSIIFYALAFSSYMASAERQIRRIRSPLSLLYTEEGWRMCDIFQISTVSQHYASRYDIL